MIGVLRLILYVLIIFFFEVVLMLIVKLVMVNGCWCFFGVIKWGGWLVIMFGR